MDGLSDAVGTRIKHTKYKALFQEEPYRRQLRNLYSMDSFLDYEEAYFNGFCEAYDHLYKWQHITRPPQIEEVTLKFVDCYYPVKARRFYTDKASFSWAAGLGDSKAKYYFPWYIY